MSNNNTPLSFRFRDDNKSPDSTDSPAWENFKCTEHPHFKVDAVCINEERNDLRLLCIKCIIEAESYSIANGDKLMTMKEMIQKYLDAVSNSGEKSTKSKDNLQEKFLSFLTKDYIGIYEQQVENQFKTVDQEIKDLIQSLNTLRDKYKEHVTSELISLRMKGDEIRGKIKTYLDENPEMESSRFSSVHEIQDRLSRISTRDELYEFMKQLYLRSKESYEEKEEPDFRATLNMMEEIKNKVAEIQDTRVDISKLKGKILFFPF